MLIFGILLEVGILRMLAVGQNPLCPTSLPTLGIIRLFGVAIPKSMKWYLGDVQSHMSPVDQVVGHCVHC